MERLLAQEGRELAGGIARTLRENEVDLVQGILQVLGKETTVSLFERTLQLLSEGGLERQSGGQRTSGGIFFYLVKTSVTAEQKSEIFRERDKKKRQERRAQRALLKKLNKLRLDSAG